MTKKIIKDRDKGTKLISVLNKNLDGMMNKARIKFLGLFICALCKLQTVSFQKLAGAFECAAQSDSSLRRMQRVMAACNLAGYIITHLIFSLLPHRYKYRPAMDRTNRKFGETNINVLTLVVTLCGQINIHIFVL
jgi:hypothetical protein